MSSKLNVLSAFTLILYSLRLL